MTRESPRPNRDGPCPCGSGRKYKRCCWRKDTMAQLAWSPRDSDRAFARLLAFADTPQLLAQKDQAIDTYWGDSLERVEATDPEGREELARDENSFFAFLYWFLFDFPLADGGATVAERYLESGPVMSAGERTWLERMRASAPHLYEIAEVRLEEGFTLRDVWSGEEVRVRERLGTHQLVQWDLMAARVITGPRGAPEIFGVPLAFPTRERAQLLKELKRHHRRVERAFPGAASLAFWRQMVPMLHQRWVALHFLQPTPSVRTVEGDPVAFVKTIFDVRDRQRVEAALGADPRFEQTDEGYVWLERAGDMTRTLGDLSFDGRRLTLSTMSAPRAERGRTLLASLLGGAATYRATAEENLEIAMAASRRTRGRAKRDDVPPDVQQEVVGAYLAQHYRRWMDDPVPALGGRTPRNAARLKTGRPAVRELVKQIENGMERARLQGQPWVDVSFLRGELKLD